MSEITVEPATKDCFDDAQHVFAGGGDGPSCQCQWWTLTNAEFSGTERPALAKLLREQLGAEVAPALIARVDGEAIGWVRVGPRTTQARLARTRDLAANSEQPWDDPSVWAVSCFVVRKEHRGNGVMARLLDAAIEHARAHGARVVEGYPFDPTTAKKSANQLFRGVLSVFEDAGFRIVARPKPDRTIVSLDLAEKTT